MPAIKRLAFLILIFFGLAFALAMIGAMARASEMPGTVCESIDRLLARGLPYGMGTHERIDDAASMERARDVFDAMPPPMPRPRGQWLLMADLRDGSLVFGFVTCTMVCDIGLVPAAMAPAARRFILGDRA